MNTLYLNKQEKDFFKRIKPIIFDKRFFYLMQKEAPLMLF